MIPKNKKYNLYKITECSVLVFCSNGDFICDLDDWNKLKHYY